MDLDFYSYFDRYHPVLAIVVYEFFSGVTHSY